MFLILPGMLYKNVDRLKNQVVYLLEEPVMFKTQNYSSLRIEYNRRCMTEYKKYLTTKNIKCHYIKIDDVNNFYHSIDLTTCYSYNPLDREIIKKWKGVSYYDPLNFILTETDILKLNYRRLTPVYHYVLRSIGLNEYKSTDINNRKKLPHNLLIDRDDILYLPINHKQAINYLKYYIANYLSMFAPYQDAIEKDNIILYHTGLSAAINMGLITPQDILSHLPKNKIRYEALIRQIFGWREYMYYIFIKHRDHVISCKYHTNKHYINIIPRTWYTGKTDHYIFNTELHKAVKYSYAHHITRLMIFLCLMNLYNFSPESIIRWFKRIVSIDAYDWVMFSNIYCMGYYCPHFTSKSYICSSAYILRMSNSYRERDSLWDKLYRQKK